MANGKIKTLFSDAEKTEALFPRTKTSAISDVNGVGLDALLENITGNYATQSFVTNKIAEAQLSGGGSGDIDLSGYATKDDLAGITPAKIGALPIVGGNITGHLTVGNKLDIWTDSEGGNIRIVPRDESVVDYWDIDGQGNSSEALRIFAYKKATNPNGAGYTFPLTLHTDGSAEFGNVSKTRERLGIEYGVSLPAAGNAGRIFFKKV